jgi:hypothetical protein
MFPIIIIFFKSKWNSSQHGFIKSKSTITNSVTFLDFVTPLFCSQSQTDSIYFDFSNAFEFFHIQCFFIISAIMDYLAVT